MNKPVTISGLEEIYKNYDVFILDQWGVMHNGIDGYVDAIDCVNKLADKKKVLTIISNSSKRKKTTIERLDKLGFNSNYFLEVMTSGEMIWKSLYNNDYNETKKLGKNCFYIYNEENKDGLIYLDSLAKYNKVDSIDEADFILGCTPFINKKVFEYIPLLDKAKKNNLPFICANPDFDTIENSSNKLSFCMGTIAELYKNIGGNIFILGKPSVEIYYKIINNLPLVKKSRILAVGDSIFHDIKGANNFGIDSLLITSTGIHKESFDKIKPNWNSNKNTLAKLDINPTFICSDFTF
mgnify:CR=1 FL=1|tara:strand:- start:295 stop:1179 length:885 start_codon:yes stop_codon:yes gene_type:complete